MLVDFLKPDTRVHNRPGNVRRARDLFADPDQTVFQVLHAAEKIRHVPKVLYLWRSVPGSTAADVHFLSAARGSCLTAEARQIRSGRRTCLFSVTITDDLGAQAAYITITGMKTMTREKAKRPAEK